MAKEQATPTIIREDEQVITVDLEKNPKQWQYFVEVLKSCNGLSNCRRFVFGGAIRGGKSFVTLFILVYLCKRYPGSRWVVIRASFPSLQKTTIESLKKIINYSSAWKWNQDKGNFFAQHDNGSRIYFMAENLKADPDLTAFLGLEVNGVFFEQLEELSHKLWDIAGSRAGSWYINPMPPAFRFTTFNPAQTWIKEEIYKKYLDGTLPDDFMFMLALPSDNAFVTQDQWEQWQNMTDRYQRQFIEGDWTNFDDSDPRWLHSFDSAKHVKPVPFLPSFPVHLSFDFNNTPLEATAWQFSPSMGNANSFVHCVAEFSGEIKLEEMCSRIRARFPTSILYVTGDRSGQNDDVGRNQTLYQMIGSFLKLSKKQMNLNTANLEHADSRELMNALFSDYPNVFISPDCKSLIRQCEGARVNLNSLKPSQLLKDRKEHKLDAFDSMRYFFQTYFLEYATKKYFRISI